MYKEVLKWFTAWLYIALTVTENANNTKITFHRIPRDMNLRKKWIIAIKGKDPAMTDKSSVFRALLR